MRGDEDEQLELVVPVALAAEDAAEERYVGEERDPAADAVALLACQAPKHRRVPVAHEELCAHRARADDWRIQRAGGRV